MKGIFKPLSLLLLFISTASYASVHTGANSAKSDNNHRTGLLLKKPLHHVEVTTQKQILILRENSLLSQEIKSWADKVGYKLLWNSESDYMIFTDTLISGKSNDEILNELGRIFVSENYGLVIKFYSKNKVLIIDGQ
jgi:toxin co-regulated pilus biosynthesis protein Q